VDNPKQQPLIVPSRNCSTEWLFNLLVPPWQADVGIDYGEYTQHGDVRPVVFWNGRAPEEEWN
jgi:hypothetical protein